MLREFQEEIARLRSQLENAGSGGGGGGGGGPGKTIVEKVVVEKVVEKVVEVNKGMDEAKVRELEEKAAAEREAIKKKAEAEMQELLEMQSKTEEEKRALAEQLQKKQEAEQEEAKERAKMARKLAALQEKLLVGGKMLDLAQKQEADLKRAQVRVTPPAARACISDSRRCCRRPCAPPGTPTPASVLTLLHSSPAWLLPPACDCDAVGPNSWSCSGRRRSASVWSRTTFARWRRRT